MPSAPSLPQHTQDLPHPIIMENNDGFEEIELETFPKHLPLRPEKRSRWLALKQRPVRWLITFLLLLITLVGTAFGALFVGRVIQHARQEQLPAVASTSVATSVVTHTSTVTNRPMVVESQSTSLVTVTMTATAAPAGSLTPQDPPPLAPSESNKPAVTASPGRQKPGTG
jgi:hypothetical protein